MANLRKLTKEETENYRKLGFVVRNVLFVVLAIVDIAVVVVVIALQCSWCCV